MDVLLSNYEESLSTQDYRKQGSKMYAANFHGTKAKLAFPCFTVFFENSISSALATAK